VVDMKLRRRQSIALGRFRRPDHHDSISPR
jgi:hypothetical protein